MHWTESKHITVTDIFAGNIVSLIFKKKKSNEKWGPPKNRLEIIKKMIKPLNIIQKVTVVTHYHF